MKFKEVKVVVGGHNIGSFHVAEDENYKPNDWSLATGVLSVLSELLKDSMPGDKEALARTFSKLLLSPSGKVREERTWDFEDGDNVQNK